VSEIDAVYFASTSAPYAEKQNASTIATALGCKSVTATVDTTSSTRSGTSALLSCLDFVASGRGRTGLVAAGDCPLGDPTGTLEHQLGAAAAAVIVGREQVAVQVEGSFSVLSETLGERFRRHDQSYVTSVDLGPYHEREVDQVVTSCMKGMMDRLRRSPKDYAWFVLQGLDDGKAMELSKKLGFEDSKIAPSVISTRIGDVGAASPLLALSKLLESTLQGQRVILCSYGPGGGADALSLSVGRAMKPANGTAYEDYLARKEYIDYIAYMKVRRIIGKS
jgi:3-hydroxy-3-methylglutaryl CoA synthase